MRTADLVAWLRPQVDASVQSGNGGWPGSSGRLVVLTRYGGTGLSTQGLLDAMSVQTRVCGNAGQPDDAEALAEAVDRALLAGPFPRSIAGQHVLRITRVGSPPAYDRVDAGGRTQFVCSYSIDAQSVLTL